MSFARDLYTATEEQTDFTITFPYLADEDVEVYQNGTLKTVTTDYTIVSETTVRLVTEATAGDIVILLRNTSQSTRIVDYASASSLGEEDLDDDSLQAFYMCQEALDSAALALGVDAALLWDAENVRITEVGTPTADADAATKLYVDTVLLEEGNLPASTEAEDGDMLVVTVEGVAAWAEMAEAYIPDGLIDAGMMAALTITEAELAAESVIASKIETATITETQLANESVTGLKVEDGSINTEHFTALGVTEAVLASESVTLAKIESASGTEGQYLKNEEATGVVWHTATEGDWTYATEVDLVDEATVDLVTGLPSTVTEIEIFFDAVSTDANGSNPVIQLGHASAYDSTGYVSAGVTWIDTGAAEITAHTDGFGVSGVNWLAAESCSGVAKLSRGLDNTKWAFSATLSRDDGLGYLGGAGLVTLEGALTRIQAFPRVTTAAEIFDAGEFVVRYR